MSSSLGVSVSAQEVLFITYKEVEDEVAVRCQDEPSSI